MKVHGREIKFLRTVGAVSEVAEVCPQGNISKLAELFKSENTVTINDTWATLIVALNKGYEMAHRFADKKYKPNPLTKEECYTLSEDEFSQLMEEASEAWLGDKVTIEVEESKKKAETNETSD